MNTAAVIPIPFIQGKTDVPLDVSEEECELTENEVDMLMDALDAEDDNTSVSNASIEDAELGTITPIENNNVESRYSFSLPLESEADDAGEDDKPTEDVMTEPASGSDEPLVAPSASIPLNKVLRKRVKQEEDEEESPSKKVKASPGRAKKDEWDETRAVSHLLLSPYDASFGLLSRVDTR